MSIEFDMPDVASPEREAFDEHDAAEILARYWNDRETPSVNVETISWWLRQSNTADPC